VSTDDVSETTAVAISRRGAVAGLVTAMVPAAFSVATPQAAAEAIPTSANLEDERLMREALALAAEGDLPFGAVIVRDGKILARGLNLGKRTHDPTAHGEMVAIRRCLADHNPEALKGTVLYTSGEPCAMCMGAIVWCGIGRVVYAASIAEIEAHLGQIRISCTEIAEKTPFETIEITGGVLAAEALKLFR
jgi:tRNA(adenine34) deaminase